MSGILWSETRVSALLDFTKSAFLGVDHEDLLITLYYAQEGHSLHSWSGLRRQVCN